MKTQDLKAGDVICDLKETRGSFYFIESVTPTGAIVCHLFGPIKFEAIKSRPSVISYMKNPGHEAFTPFTSEFWVYERKRYGHLPALIGNKNITIEC